MYTHAGRLIAGFETRVNITLLSNRTCKTEMKRKSKQEPFFFSSKLIYCLDVDFEVSKYQPRGGFDGGSW
jgi:hypothetical protein